MVRKGSQSKLEGNRMNTLPKTAIWAFLMIATGMPSNSLADIVTDWNVIATTTAPAAGMNPLLQSRIYAMVHAATHDALNAIEPRYQPYVFQAHSTGASPEAAVAAAAHGVLTSEIPAQQAALDAAYVSSLSGVPDGPAKSYGILVGQAAAAAILSVRHNDGSTAIVPYTPGTGPGVWVPTPPAFLPAISPGWGNVTPFVLNSGEQFRPDPPDYFNLGSEEYARDYNEVKRIGEMNSTTRTVQQSEIARFWYEGSPVGWNRIARVVSSQAGLDLWENGRLFALVNFAMADGFIAGFNIRFFYNFWRPVTAIRAGDSDGNSNTAADPAWSSYLVTPPIPDFPSTHSVLGAAAAEVLARSLGTDFVTFSVESGAPFPGILRSYDSFSQAAQENAQSRVYAGIHFRSACTHGLRIGENIGASASKHYLQPVSRSSE
jgi:hypothetical protein